MIISGGSHTICLTSGREMSSSRKGLAWLERSGQLCGSAACGCAVEGEVEDDVRSQELTCCAEAEGTRWQVAINNLRYLEE